MSSAAANQPASTGAVAHVFVAASVATAAFMLMTANELGPFGPLVIALAIYLASFALIFELLLLAVRAWSFMRSALRLRAGKPLTAEGAAR